jgi:hypothetical protein
MNKKAFLSGLALAGLAPLARGNNLTADYGSTGVFIFHHALRDRLMLKGLLKLLRNTVLNFPD